jgi:lincosamide nucleotidyltransferase B/F
VLFQQALIARGRDVCGADQGLDAALMYGSFAAGEADEHSDIEFWLFFTPDRLAAIDPHAWCLQIAPVTYMLRNEFGSHVAFFPHLVRGEFHFAATQDIESVGAWPARGAEVERMIVIDRDGRLAPVLQALPQRYTPPSSGPAIFAEYCDPFANWLVLAHHLLARGEHLRAWDALAHAQRYLLWMARLVEDATTHWLTPSRGAEAELTPATVAAVRAATSAATPEGLHVALRAASREGRRLWQELADRYEHSAPSALFDELDAALGTGS